MIGFACGSAGQAMPPPGGLTAILGTNPLGYAYPARRHDPVILDNGHHCQRRRQDQPRSAARAPHRAGAAHRCRRQSDDRPARPGRRRADAAHGRLQGVRLGDGRRLSGGGIDRRRVRAHRRHHARPGRDTSSGRSISKPTCRCTNSCPALTSRLTRSNSPAERPASAKSWCRASAVNGGGDNCTGAAEVPLPGVSWAELGRLCADLDVPAPPRER